MTKSKKIRFSKTAQNDMRSVWRKTCNFEIQRMVFMAQIQLEIKYVARYSNKSLACAQRSVEHYFYTLARGTSSHKSCWIFSILQAVDRLIQYIAHVALERHRVVLHKTHRWKTLQAQTSFG